MKLISIFRSFTFWEWFYAVMKLISIFRSFTFWEWFYAVMKLTKEDLRAMWMDGYVVAVYGALAKW